MNQASFERPKSQTLGTASVAVFLLLALQCLSAPILAQNAEDIETKMLQQELARNQAAQQHTQDPTQVAVLRQVEKALRQRLEQLAALRRTHSEKKRS